MAWKNSYRSGSSWIQPNSNEQGCLAFQVASKSPNSPLGISAGVVVSVAFAMSPPIFVVSIVFFFFFSPTLTSVVAEVSVARFFFFCQISLSFPIGVLLVSYPRSLETHYLISGIRRVRQRAKQNPWRGRQAGRGGTRRERPRPARGPPRARPRRGPPSPGAT